MPLRLCIGRFFSVVLVFYLTTMVEGRTMVEVEEGKVKRMMVEVIELLTAPKLEGPLKKVIAVIKA